MPVHICTGTVAIVHKCTIMHKLMCVFFSSNCVKLTIFFILHNYGRADVIALTVILHFNILLVFSLTIRPPHSLSLFALPLHLFFSISLSLYNRSICPLTNTTQHHLTTTTTTTLQYIIIRPQNQRKIKHTHTRHTNRERERVLL